MVQVEDAPSQRANRRFIQMAMQENLLSREEEFELARRLRQGDTTALHQLVRAYTRLVVSAATRFRHYGLPVSDLVQEGNVGLMIAACRFDPQRDVRFSTYAVWWIRAAIQDFVLRNWSIVRTGTTAAQKTLFFNLRRLQNKIERETGHAIDDAGRARIARELEVAESEVADMERRISFSDQSLNMPLDDCGDTDWQSLLPDEAPSPEEVVIRMRDGEIQQGWLTQAMDSLSPRERRIIAERQLRDTGTTLEELGLQLGISKERVRQLEARALDKIRKSVWQRAQAV